MKRIIGALFAVLLMSGVAGAWPFGPSGGGGAGGAISHDQSGSTDWKFGAINIGTTNSIGIPGVNPDGVINFDGVVDAPSTPPTENGSSTTVTAPGTETDVPDSAVLNIYAVCAENWATAPGVGTNRINEPWSGSGWQPLLYANEQTLPSAGNVASVSGTSASGLQAWLTASVPFNALPGKTVTYRASSTGNFTSANGSILLEEPSGVQSGDQMLACIAANDIATEYTAPMGWNYIIDNIQYSGSNWGLTCWEKSVSATDPSLYAWNISGANQPSGTWFIISYANVGVIGRHDLVSASANFNSYDVGKLICVNGVAANGNDDCGVILSDITSSEILTSVDSWKTSQITSQEYRYGTDYYSKMQNFINAFPNGLNLKLPIGNYVLSNGLTALPDVPLIIEGSGAAVPNTENSYLNGNTGSNVRGGTNLWFLTKNMTVPGFSISGTLNHTSMTAAASLSNLTLYAGVGRNFDGGGADGIDILNWQDAALDDVNIFNFKGNGVYIDGLQAGSGQNYSEGILLNRVFVEWNGGYGIQLGGLANNVENIKIDTCFMENNGLSGLYIKKDVQGLSMTGSLVQWNNVLTPGPEILWGTGNFGISMKGNYLEEDTNGLSQSNAFFGGTQLMPFDPAENACTPGPSGNVFAPCFPVTYTTSTLPACSSSGWNATLHLSACVTDSSACTSGTTYTGGGSTPCLVQCNGTNWIETGTSAGCN